MNRDRANPFDFFLQTLRPVLFLFALLSVGLNVYLLSRSDTPSPAAGIPTSSASSGSTVADLAPRAFGTILRGVPIVPQSVAGLAAPRTYDLSPTLLQDMPSDLPFYRDRGTVNDSSMLSSLSSRLGAPRRIDDDRAIPTLVRFSSPDRTREISFDIPSHRMLFSFASVQAKAVPGNRADDPEVIALAVQTLTSLGFQPSAFGTPRVVDRSDDGQPKTFVTWDADIGGRPLLDLSLRPYPRAEVQVGRVSHRVIAGSVSLLDAHTLPHAAYPVAAMPVLQAALRSGGLRPLAGAETDTAPSSAAYTRTDIVYVLLPPDGAFALSILPAVRAVWTASPSCDGCAPVELSTFVPALDPDFFSWTPEAQR